jgi:hypothetical protein
MTDSKKLKFIVSTFSLMKLNAERAADIATTLNETGECGDLVILADDYVTMTTALGLRFEALMNRLIDQEATQEVPKVDLGEAS